MKIKLWQKIENINLYEHQLKVIFPDIDWNNISKDKKKKLLYNWINIKILSQEYENNEKDYEDIIYIKFNEDKLKANLLLNKKIKEDNISKQELFDYYKLHEKKYTKVKTLYKTQRIFTKEYNKFNQIKKYIIEENKNNKNYLKTFTQTAKLFSDEGIGKYGGYTGYISQKDTEEEIWESLENNNIYTVFSVKTNKGYYLMRYYETKEIEEKEEFELIKEEIYKELKDLNIKKSINDLIDKYKEKYKIYLYI